MVTPQKKGSFNLLICRIASDFPSSIKYIASTGLRNMNSVQAGVTFFGTGNLLNAKRRRKPPVSNAKVTRIHNAFVRSSRQSNKEHQASDTMQHGTHSHAKNTADHPRSASH
jgi:hypothetical protein